MSQSPILVTGAAGRIGGVGGEVVDILRSKGPPVRAQHPEMFGSSQPGRVLP
jgi:nucleoside-diphosphate-sugar epimerase